ncbi:MAG: ATP synthase F1 subunit gamma [Vallitaleaceae bacterium]|nr:ATP synthase F1 subunit gamma [Vallitaleaceae bacterium]
MASMRDIKRRKNSIQSTQQITKAMKLVATAKLQKAKVQAVKTRPYFHKMHGTITSILAQSGQVNHKYLDEREGKHNTYIVVTSNRGLAGGYNNNVCKMVMNHREEGEDASVIAVGRKGRDLLKRRGFNIIESYNEMVDMPEYGDAATIGTEVLKRYVSGEIDHVYIAYTAFESTLNQEAKLIKLLPLDLDDFAEEKPDEEHLESGINYEPSVEEVLDSIIPQYVNSIIFGALKESIASEHGARMTAMDSATSNASDMIDKLTLQYNRARQASITQELSEIVGGAEALK